MDKVEVRGKCNDSVLGISDQKKKSLRRIGVIFLTQNKISGVLTESDIIDKYARGKK